MIRVKDLIKGRFVIAMTAGLLISVSLFSGFSRYDATPLVHRETMQRSNQLYENGRFQEASQTYQQLVDLGVEHENLFYNLGNAYYKSGDLGRAVLNYERARRMAPRDADIRANLDFARSLALDRYESEATSPLEDWVGFAAGGV